MTQAQIPAGGAVEAGEAKPVRLQLSRKKGFDLQTHSLATNGLPAIVVARPSRWGNPWTLEEAADVFCCGKDEAHTYVVGWFREWLTQSDDHHDQSEHGSYGYAREERARMLDSLSDLRGKNLACWCHREHDCHADVLLDLANRPVCDDPAADPAARALPLTSKD